SGSPFHNFSAAEQAIAALQSAADSAVDRPADGARRLSSENNASEPQHAGNHVDPFDTPTGSRVAPLSGGCDLDSAIRLATTLVQKSPNIRKQVVLLTDNQQTTWDAIVDAGQASTYAPSATTDDERADDRDHESVDEANDEPGDSRDDSTDSNTARHARTLSPTHHGAADGNFLAASPTAPESEITWAVQIAELPETPENFAVDRVQIMSPFSTTGRPLPIEVEIRNGGVTTVRDLEVTLLVDDFQTAVQSIGQLEPGVSTTLRFTHSFSTAGQHTVTGHIARSDQLTADNQRDAIVSVTAQLSILLVNGSAMADRTQQSATFAQLALDPVSLRAAPLADNQPAAQKADADAQGARKPLKQVAPRAIRTTTVDAMELAEMDQLDDFHIVILCDVPRLPARTADRLATFVTHGGGLWVIPGEPADQKFYNDWQSPESAVPVIPAVFGEHIAWPQHIATPRIANGDAGRNDESIHPPASSLGLALDAAQTSWLTQHLDPATHDLAELSVAAYRKVTPRDTAVVGLRLANDDPFLMEQSMGHGRVLLQTVALNQQDSNFLSRVSFPVLMHLWAYHLAASGEGPLHFDPTSDLTIRFPADEAGLSKPGKLTLTDPAGTNRMIEASSTDRILNAHVGVAAAPGVYSLHSQTTGDLLHSFTIGRDQRESDLRVISGERLQELVTSIGFQRLRSIDELNPPAVGAAVGREIWDFLIFMVLWLLATECLICRWIRIRRSARQLEMPQATSLFQTPLPGMMPSVEGSRRSHSREIPAKTPFAVGGRR
ncbi:MAG: hypothetical protein KDA96_21910, partial [Planctomycetaceae bacterium]|nr:hypothetical protein [Planctomycetaceae bacterium]